ncbi:MAG: carboxypeptidase regulatory-like domain-containing protein, partial [Thermoplasmata archaeon]|nr:carboxypeptidase regulatory-like domain-containing protein [Thermoplasmata archaeon]
SIGASAPYFESNSTIVALPGTGVVHLTVRLTSAPAATIDVTVLDSSSHQTVPVAQINFSSAGPLPSGVANFSRQTTFGILVLSLAAGNYTVRAWAPGYEENDSVPVQWLQPGQVTLVTILLTPRPLGVLDTIILDSSSHQPIGGANVTIATGPSVVSDRAGWANFSGLAPGDYPIQATASGYFPNETSVFLVSGEMVHRFSINLTRSPSNPVPGGQTNQALLPPDAQSVWPLLLLPLGALFAAIVYLTLLRVPTAPLAVSGRGAPAPTSRRHRSTRRVKTDPPVSSPGGKGS